MEPHRLIVPSANEGYRDDQTLNRVANRHGGNLFGNILLWILLFPFMLAWSTVKILVKVFSLRR
jgi:hypothetical protein